MFAQVLTAVALFFVVYASCHYTLSTVWKNETGRLVVSAVFATLCVMFANLL